MPRSRPASDLTGLLLTPKWIGLTLLVVLLSVAFAFASSWQYQRAMDQVNAQRVANARPAPIAELVPAEGKVPNAALGRTATVAGRYTAHVWVPNRASGEGRPGVWLVSGLDDGSGALTAVLRGWLPEPVLPADPGPVAVSGTVSSEENFYPEAAPTRPGELATITDAGLSSALGAPVRPGYLVLAEQRPALAAADPQPVQPVFGAADSVGFPWQNAGYAMQWAVFIAFVGFMYWRFLRDDLRAAQDRTLKV